MGQGLSDVFYPDNPKRRARADELKHDIEAFAKTYKEIEANRSKILEQIKEPLAQILAAKGYDTPAKLDAKVQSILTGEHLKKYLEVKATHDKNSDLEKLVFTISSFVSIGAGVFLGGMALLGVITGGAALSILGYVGIAVAVVAVVLVLFAAIEGARERSNLRDAISKLGPQRVQVRRALFAMEAISNWLLHVRSYCRDVSRSGDVSEAEELWEGDFKTDMAKSEHAATVKWLEEYDRNRGSWTNEDGDWKRDPTAKRKVVAGAAAHVEAHADVRVGLVVQALEILGLAEGDVAVSASVGGRARAKELVAKAVLQHIGTNETFSFTISEVTEGYCLAKDPKGEEWALLPETIAAVGGQLDIKNCVFSIQKTSDGTTLEDMKVIDFTPVP